MHQFTINIGITSMQGPEWIPMSLANKFSLQHARSHTLTDKWELFPEEINISKGNPLGTGCFGVVYKGVVRRQTVSAGQNSMRKKRLAKLALPHAVAIKTLKGCIHLAMAK